MFMEWRERIREVLLESLDENERAYLLESKQKIQKNYRAHFVRIFSSLGREISNSSKNQTFHISCATDLPLIIEDWSTIRLARVWLLGLIEDEPSHYHQFVNRLFAYAEMEESVALYSALNILHYPELWISRCEEGIRSNIGAVQQAIMEQNRYPAKHLSKGAWNQLVLKSFFTEKNILKIVGLSERNNADLAHAIIDYIYERHSADRTIHPILWLLSKDYLPQRAWDILNERRNNATDSTERTLLGRLLDERNVKSVSDESSHEQPSSILTQELLEKLKKEKICAQN